jgi:hypothetical protein
MIMDLPEAIFTAFVVGMFLTMIFVFCGVLS